MPSPNSSVIGTSWRSTVHSGNGYSIEARLVIASRRPHGVLTASLRGEEVERPARGNAVFVETW